MRHTIIGFAMLAAGACANSAEPAPPYDEAAQILGAEVATADGGSTAAIADVAQLAYGSVPDHFVRTPLGYVEGKHDGITYEYLVSCRDAAGKPMTCGETSATAHALVGWGGTLITSTGELPMWHHGTFDLLGLHGGDGWVTGTAWATYGNENALNALTETALAIDVGSLTFLGGSVTATVQVVDVDGNAGREFPAEVVFDRSTLPTIVIDDHRYWLDLATGEVSIATVVE